MFDLSKSKTTIVNKVSNEESTNTPKIDDLFESENPFEEPKQITTESVFSEIAVLSPQSSIIEPQINNEEPTSHNNNFFNLDIDELNADDSVSCVGVSDSKLEEKEDVGNELVNNDCSSQNDYSDNEDYNNDILSDQPAKLVIDETPQQQSNDPSSRFKFSIDELEQAANKVIERSQNNKNSLFNDLTECEQMAKNSEHIFLNTEPIPITNSTSKNDKLKLFTEANKNDTEYWTSKGVLLNAMVKIAVNEDDFNEYERIIYYGIQVAFEKFAIFLFPQVNPIKRKELQKSFAQLIFMLTRQKWISYFCELLKTNTGAQVICIVQFFDAFGEFLAEIFPKEEPKPEVKQIVEVENLTPPPSPPKNRKALKRTLNTISIASNLGKKENAPNANGLYDELQNEDFNDIFIPNKKTKNLMDTQVQPPQFERQQSVQSTTSQSTPPLRTARKIKTFDSFM